VFVKNGIDLDHFEGTMDSVIVRSISMQWASLYLTPAADVSGLAQ